jgi:MHS family alpha-ketoglutarate permease-like MFS transporter
MNSVAPRKVRQPIDRRRLRAIIAGSVGNLIEWYDFYAYAYTALYFASAFFPTGDRTAQLLSVAAIYAAGFLIRPLGGWYFGRFADRHGRRTAMVFSVVLMGIGSLLIGMLPTYATIGLWAPAGLLVARVLQGFSTGGQYGAAATYLSEMAPPDKRGFYASFQFVTLIAGQLLAIMVLQVIQLALPDEAIRAWAWRVPFFIGAVLAATVILFRHVMEETVAPTKSGEAGSMRALARHPRSIFVVATLSSAGAICLYTFTTYMQKFLVNTAGIPIRDASRIMMFAMAAFMLLQPVIGNLSDHIGRRVSLMLFSGVMAVAAVPLLYALSVVQSGLAATALVLLALFILSFYTSISGLFKAELFPTHIRALGVGFVHSTAAAIFGGTVELFALQARQSNQENYFFWYVSISCFLAFLSLLWMEKRPTLDMD